MAYTKDIGLKDFYEFYKTNSLRKNKEFVDYKTFSSIIKDANLLLRDKIIYNNERPILPYNMGVLGVLKFKTTYNDNNERNWKVDFKATKEQGRVVYFVEPYGYTWKWFKDEAKLNGKQWYSFKPCRKASRLIKDAVKNKNLDFYTK